MSVELQQLIARVEKVEKLHADFQHWNNSRRGVEGQRGLQGIPGVGTQGPQGAPGKDADVSAVIQAAKQQMQSDFEYFQARLSGAIVQELKRSGVVDESGKAVLMPGPAGADSTVWGPSRP